MNKKQRDNNRRNHRALLEAVSYKESQKYACENCGERGRHWVQWPISLQDIMEGNEPSGFWICSNLYDETGVRKSE